MKRILLLLFPVMLLAGCGSMPALDESAHGRFAFTYASAKVISEFDQVTPADVIAWADRIEPLVRGQTGSVAALIDLILGETALDRFSPEDQALAHYLIELAEAYLAESGIVTEDLQSNALALLGAVRQGARLAGG